MFKLPEVQGVKTKKISTSLNGEERRGSGVDCLGALIICTEISEKNFHQMVLRYFIFAPKTGTGLSCTIYKILVNFSLSPNLKPGTGNPNKWYRKFLSFQ